MHIPKKYQKYGRWLILFSFITALLLVSLVAGLYARSRLNTNSANETIDARNITITDALKNHPVKLLVGESERVSAINKTDSQKMLTFKNCTEITSTNNRANLNTSFAFLLSYDNYSKSVPSCTLKQVVAAYGRPNASALIAGTFNQPKETLLFYDGGVHKGATTISTLPATPATVVPIGLNQLTPIVCTTTTLSVVAHQDDDLLFLSPNLLHDIQNGSCTRTVYLTAGDAGNSQYYWLSRQHGSEAAYSSMTPQNDDIWIERIIKLSDKQYVTIASPKNNPKISLIFMHLPDGNIDGTGFKAYNHESLAKLASGRIRTMTSVDTQSKYTTDQLLSALVSLMNYFQPKIVRTQSTQHVLKGNPYLDHSDHNAAGSYGQLAFKKYSGASTSSLFTYFGYGIHGMTPNVLPADYLHKQAAFLKYAHYDGGVCQTVLSCDSTNNIYHYYLASQYQSRY